MPKQISLDDKYAPEVEHAYLTGIEALVRLPIMQRYRDVEAGLNTAGFVSGYRGSPVGTVDLSMWKAAAHLDKHHIRFQPGVNEDLAATAVWGTQQSHLMPGAKYDGVFAMWYGKGPGVDRSMDVIKHANAFGTTQFGGVLAVAGDDHACKSSTLPHQSEPMLIGAAVPVLNPANVQEVLDYGMIGWALSRYSGCWVGLKVITENMDSAISADIRPQRISIRLPQDSKAPAGGLNAQWPTTPLQQEELLYNYRISAALDFARANHLNQITLNATSTDKTAEPRLGIVATGKSYLDVLEALQYLGLDQPTAAAIGIRLYKIGMSWPLEPTVTCQFAKGLKEIVVVEEKRNIVEDQLITQLYRLPDAERPTVVGKFDQHGASLITSLGELTPTIVARVLGKRIASMVESKTLQQQIIQRLEFLEAKQKRIARTSSPLTRTPYFCSGCPHNTSTRIPEGSIGMAGIGCHYMVKWMNRNTEIFTQMGGEGASWVGIAPFTSTPHVFQNIGDGTYFHSGILAIRAAVAAGVNITYKVLFNDAVAMTGGQPMDGSLNLAELVAQLQAEGVAKLAVVSDNPKNAQLRLRGVARVSIHARRELEQLQREFRQLRGTTAIIYDQVCATEKRRRRKRGIVPQSPTRVFINAAVCEGCGDCSDTSNCLSVLPKQTELGNKRQIEQNACNQDFTCLDGFCPSFVSVTGATLRVATDQQPQMSETPLPTPQLPSLDQPWNILITGIGGTGVLTLGSLLAMAAHLEGKGCSTLNQTGLAQKFGAVVGHVRIANTQPEIYAGRIAEGNADVLLGCDLVVASMSESLARLHSARSHAVVNTDENPTADFIHQQNYRFPSAGMQQLIRQEVNGNHSSHRDNNQTGNDKTDFVNATRITRNLLGNPIGSNLFLLGFAYQRGLIPLRTETINQAIQLNNVAVEFNQQAFTLGRRAAVNQSVVESTADAGTDSVLTDINDVIAWRHRYLIAYQNQQYADKYRVFVERIQQFERDLNFAPPSIAEFTASHCELASSRDATLQHAPAHQPTSLAEIVAHNYFKLLAYKDEYEIARLYCNGQFIADIKKQFAGPFKLNFHLAVPWLSRKNPLNGHLIKRKYPSSVLQLFGVLTRFKFLRGTWLDPFGYQPERKQERQLITDYENDLVMFMEKITPHNYTTALEIAALPQMIKGFGHVKSGNIAKYRENKKALFKKFHQTETPLAKK